MTRQAKTPRQRAQDALEVEERRLKKLGTKKTETKTDLDRLTRELEQLTTDYDAAVVRRDHAKQHPDLTPTTTPSGGSTT